MAVVGIGKLLNIVVPIVAEPVSGMISCVKLMSSPKAMTLILVMNNGVSDRRKLITERSADIASEGFLNVTSPPTVAWFRSIIAVYNIRVLLGTSEWPVTFNSEMLIYKTRVMC